MTFCPECGSLLHYAELENKLVNICKTCGYKVESDETLIQAKHYKKTNYNNFQNHQYYIYNPSFTRTIHYNCPNNDCVTHKNSDKKEAIFFNKKNSLKQAFICVACKTEWTY